jgi:hypothetical protein
MTGSWIREPAMLLVTALVAALYVYGYGDKIAKTEAVGQSVDQPIVMSGAAPTRLIR